MRWFHAELLAGFLFEGKVGTEIIRYTQLGKEDIRFGTGTFEVILADGRKVVLNEVDVAQLFTLKAYTFANLPMAGTAGKLARVTDINPGLYYDNGTNWVLLVGEDGTTSALFMIGYGLTRPLTIKDAAGLTGRRISIEATGTGAAEIQLVPGSSANPASQLTSQIMFIHKAGTDLERFTMQTITNEYILDSSYNNAGTPRSIVIQAGGRDLPTPISGRAGIRVYGDASVDIHASTYSASGKTWGATFARFVDLGDSGSTRVILDTRTTTPSSNTADSSYMTYRRGGSTKWSAGLNVSSLNADTFDIYGNGGAWVSFYEQNSGPVIELSNECSADPGAPAANRVRLYIKDSGAGKTQLMALFSSGAAQQLAIQP